TVRSGSRSVRIEDPSSTLGVGLRSAQIPITPGTVYNGSVYAYNVSGRSSLYLEFWDAGGTRTAFEFQTNTQLDMWHRLRIASEAPEGAVHATLLLYLDAGNTGVTFFDDAELIETIPDQHAELFGIASVTGAA